ncbi:MAG: hypothetical protein WBP79_13615 [Candidatus Acidiferrales bacterium]
MDEHRVAGGYAAALDKLTDSDTSGVEKLLVDVLDKCSKLIEPPRPGDRSAADAPVTVQLIHYLDRPARNELPASPPSSAHMSSP